MLNTYREVRIVLRELTSKVPEDCRAAAGSAESYVTYMHELCMDCGASVYHQQTQGVGTRLQVSWQGRQFMKRRRVKGTSFDVNLSQGPCSESFQI